MTPVHKTHVTPHEAAGFEQGRQALRLPAPNGRPALWIRGTHLLPVPRQNLDRLSHALHRLTVQVERTRHPSKDTPLELIARAWRAITDPAASVAGLEIHHVTVDGHGLTLVLWRGELVHLYATPRPRAAARSTWPPVDPVRGVVQVTANTDQGPVAGTGMVVGPGLVLSAHHIIEDATTESIRVDGQPILAALISGPDQNPVDLVLLVLPQHRSAFEVAIRVTPVRPGEEFTVPAYPAGRLMVSHGPAIHDDPEHLYLWLPTGPGASGAPALASDGALAGITMDTGPAHTGTSYTPADRVTLIGGARIKAFLTTALARWRAEHPHLAIDQPSGSSHTAS